MENILEHVEEALKYKRKDIEGGYLDNSDEIAYFKLIQTTDIFQEQLLGDYNLSGNYIISPVIVNKLIKMPKIYRETYKDSIFCESVHRLANGKTVSFVLKFKKNSPSNGYMTCLLEVLETIKKAHGYFVNTLTTQIGSYINKDSKEFTKLAFEHFNIVDSQEVGALKEDKEEINQRIGYLYQLNQLMCKELNRYNKELFERKVKVLSTCEEGKQILKLFYGEVEEIENVFFTKKDNLYFKYLNDVLDKVLEQKSEFWKLNVEIKKELNEINKQYSVKAINLLNSGVEFYLNQITDEDQKSKFQEFIQEREKISKDEFGKTIVIDKIVINKDEKSSQKGAGKSLKVKTKEKEASSEVKQKGLDENVKASTESAKTEEKKIDPNELYAKLLTKIDRKNSANMETTKNKAEEKNNAQPENVDDDLLSL